MLPAPTSAEHLPPPVDILPTLRINSKGRAYLGQALIHRLSLRDAQPANILPIANSKFWYLDLRPSAVRSIKWYADTRPRIECIQLPSGLLQPASSLVLELVPGEPPYPGLYLLQPHAQPT
jgi:hypothetical protein